MARAGPVYSVYGNGQALDIDMTQTGTDACLLPSVVSVVLTGPDGAAAGSAESTPKSAATLSLTPGGRAKLRIDWVSQDCFTSGQPAAGGRVEWADPVGRESLVIQGLAQDAVAPCHSVFGVSDLQPLS